MRGISYPLAFEMQSICDLDSRLVISSIRVRCPIVNVNYINIGGKK